MKHVFKTVALAAALCVAYVSGSHAWDVSAMNRQIDQTNFIVNGGCSGTLISASEKLVLTNYHCIDGFVRTVTREETGPDGKVAKVKRERLETVPVKQKSYSGFEEVGETKYLTDIVAHKQTRDLALLKIKADRIPMVLSSRVAGAEIKVQRGDHAFAVGNPSGLDATVTEGVISSVSRTFEFPWTLNEKLPMLQYAGGIFGGNSGGALYNDAGMLIGVPAAGHTRATFIGLAIPASIIRDFLDEFCFASVYDEKADDAKCRADKEPKKDAGGK